jgi:alanine racemase
MDMTIIDVTGIPCELGEVVTMIGTSGGSTVTVEDTAAACGLSPYEVLTGLRQRLSRRYA